MRSVRKKLRTKKSSSITSSLLLTHSQAQLLLASLQDASSAIKRAGKFVVNRATAQRVSKRMSFDAHSALGKPYYLTIEEHEETLWYPKGAVDALLERLNK